MPRVLACGWSPQLPAALDAHARPTGRHRERQRCLAPIATDSSILRRAAGDAATHGRPAAIGRAETAIASRRPRAPPETTWPRRDHPPTAPAQIAVTLESTMTAYARPAAAISQSMPALRRGDRCAPRPPPDRRYTSSTV